MAITGLHNVQSVGFVPRLIASLYDWLLVLALMMVLSVPLVAPSNEAITPGNPFYQAGLVGLTAVFFAGFWCYSGQTLGMKAWQLKLVGEDGGTVSFTTALLRFACACVAAAPCGLGFLWVMIDKDNCSWQDRWSKTRIIRLPKNTAS